MAEKKNKAGATGKNGRKKAPVQMVVRREFVGTQTITDAFIPIIYEDIRREITEADTFDTEGMSA